MTASVQSYTRSPNITGNSGSVGVTPGDDIIGVVMSVGTYGYSGDAPPRVSYGGVPLRKVAYRNDYTGEQISESFYVLDRDVPQGTQTAQWYFSNGSIDTRHGATWVGHVWTIAGDGDGIKVVAMDHEGGGGGDLPVNPRLDLDSGDEDAVRILGLISGHNSEGSHYFVNVATNDNTDDWGNGTGRYGHTAAVSGNPDIGVNCGAEDGVLIGVAVVDGGPALNVPVFLDQNGPAGWQSSSDGATITSDARVKRQAKALVVLSVTTNDSVDILDRLEFDGEEMTELQNVVGNSRRVYAHILQDPPWTGTAKNLVAYKTASGSTGRHLHLWYFFVDGPTEPEVTSGTRTVSPGVTYWTAPAPDAGNLAIAMEVGWHNFGSHDYWCAAGSGEVWEDDPSGEGLANGATQYVHGWDMGADSTYGVVKHARSAGGSWGVTNGTSKNDHIAYVDLEFTPAGGRRKVPSILLW